MFKNSVRLWRHFCLLSLRSAENLFVWEFLTKNTVKFSDSERSIEQLIKSFNITWRFKKFIITRKRFSKAEFMSEKTVSKGSEKRHCWPRWQVPFSKNKRKNTKSFTRQGATDEAVETSCKRHKQINSDECLGNLWTERENDSTEI